MDGGGPSHVLGACFQSQVAHLGAMMPGEVDELIEGQARVYGWVSLAPCLSILCQEQQLYASGLRVLEIFIGHRNHLIQPLSTQMGKLRLES